VLAQQTEVIGNADIRPYSNRHPTDISKRLRFLVEQGWLMPYGHGRGTTYRAKNHQKSGADTNNSEHYEPRSEHYSR